MFFFICFSSQVSTEPLKEEEEENVEEEIKGENVIGEEFQVVGDTKINDEQEDRVEATKDKVTSSDKRSIAKISLLEFEIVC